MHAFAAHKPLLTLSTCRATAVNLPQEQLALAHVGCWLRCGCGAEQREGMSMLYMVVVAARSNTQVGHICWRLERDTADSHEGFIGVYGHVRAQH
jgi:hypothetical protein